MINLYRKYCFLCEKKILVKYYYDYTSCGIIVYNISCYNHYMLFTYREEMYEDFYFGDSPFFFIRNTIEGFAYYRSGRILLANKKPFGLSNNVIHEYEMIKLLY